MNPLLVLAAGGGPGHPFDKTTVIQQILGFLVVFTVVSWLILKFLVPYLRGRREKIAQTFDTLHADREQAIKAFDDFEKNLTDIEAATEEKFQAAVKEGEAARRGLVKEAQEQSDRVAIRVKRETDLEARKATQELHTACVNLSIAATERVVREKVSDDVHAGIVDRYLEQLEGVERI